MSAIHVGPPPAPKGLRLATPLAVGFGSVTVKRDGKVVWIGDDEHVWLRRFERRAAADDPTVGWSVNFLGPLSESTYRRVGSANWQLVGTGRGFA